MCIHELILLGLNSKREPELEQRGIWDIPVIPAKGIIS